MERPEITADEVRRIAALSMLRVDDGEIDGLVEHFSRVLDFVELLGEVDISVGADRLPVVDGDALRPDVTREAGAPGGPLDRSGLLGRAPLASDEAFLVPRVVSRRERGKAGSE